MIYLNQTIFELILILVKNQDLPIDFYLFILRFMYMDTFESMYISLNVNLAFSISQPWDDAESRQ